MLSDSEIITVHYIITALMGPWANPAISPGLSFPIIKARLVITLVFVKVFTFFTQRISECLVSYWQYFLCPTNNLFLCRRAVIPLPAYGLVGEHEAQLLSNTKTEELVLGSSLSPVSPAFLL